jgi:hypothetical protein
VFAIGATIAGLALIPEYIGDYLASLALGIAFQYFAIAPMRGLGLRKGLIEAAFPAHHLQPDHAAYWFLMQIGMIIGYFTAWPVNVLLIRYGIKETMEKETRKTDDSACPVAPTHSRT